MAAPSISVVIPTCDRPDDVERCLNSLTKVVYPDWSIILVDESQGSETEALAEHFLNRLPPLEYHHINGRGLSRARNVAMRMSNAEILAFLDDDCTCEPNWLQCVRVAFDRFPEAALIFGAVTATEHDPAIHFVPTCTLPEERVFNGRMSSLGLRGIGAAMYLRLSLGRAVGPMDLYAGTGARFQSSEERDYAYRALAAGFSVAETPEITVRHYGVREYRGGAVTRLVRLSPYSLAALDVKYLRCGDVVAPVLMACRLGGYLRKIHWSRLVRRGGPTGLAWVAMYLRGIIAGFAPSVMRDQMLWGRPEEYEWLGATQSSTRPPCAL